MKIAVLEYLCGGGLLSDPTSPTIYQPLYREGLAMLSALACDLSLCGHEVHTCLDSNAFADTSVQQLTTSCSKLQISEVDTNWMESWIEVALRCDRTIVIAPELHQQLERIVQALRSAGASVVASSQIFLQATSDKLETAGLFQESGVCHPATQSLTSYKASSKNGCKLDASLPVTLKRRDGAGCAEMRYFASEPMLLGWLNEPDSFQLSDNDWIVQQWHDGIPASMAIIANDEWRVLGGVEQRIELRPVAVDSESIAHDFFAVSYAGGIGPLTAISYELLEGLALLVRDALPSGALGWIGIDFVIPLSMRNLEDLCVIEVNPRLTTSYLGYRQWYGHELSNLLVGETKPSYWERKKVLKQIEFGSF